MQVPEYEGGGMSLPDFAQAMASPGAMRQIISTYDTVVVAADARIQFTATAFQNNRALNRWPDMPCYDSTRVLLEGGTNDYIHANYVAGFRSPRKYICGQGPLEQTTGDFWRMVWQQESVVVVALTRLGGAKCALYFPQRSGASQTYGDFCVRNRGTKNLCGFDATALTVSLGPHKPRRRILQLTYYAWPDKGTPTNASALLHFISLMNHNNVRLADEGARLGWLNKSAPHPIVVHCSAGVGRTGTLVALDVCSRRLDATHAGGRPSVAVAAIVTHLRRQRCKMVQRSEQFLFLHLAVLEYALARHYMPVDLVNLGAFRKEVAVTLRSTPDDI